MKRWRRLADDRGNALDALRARAEALDFNAFATDALLDQIIDAEAALGRKAGDVRAVKSLAEAVEAIEAREHAGAKVPPPKFTITLPKAPRRKKRKPVAAPEPTPLPDNIVEFPRSPTALDAWLAGGRGSRGPLTGREWRSQASRRDEPLTKGLEEMQW